MSGGGRTEYGGLVAVSQTSSQRMRHIFGLSDQRMRGPLGAGMENGVANTDATASFLFTMLVATGREGIARQETQQDDKHSHEYCKSHAANLADPDLFVKQRRIQRLA